MVESDPEGRPGPQLAFGDFVLDLAVPSLHSEGVLAGLNGRPLAVLTHLARHRNRHVSRNELRQAVWRDVAVGDAAIASALRDLRRTLGDDARRPRFIATERLRGYRFIHPAREVFAAPIRSAEHLGSVFVGRDALISEVSDFLEAALAGHGSVVLLAGEPGIGKTRTAREIGVRARLRGFSVHWGHCVEEAGAPAWWPWIQVLRDLEREDPALAPADSGGRAAVGILPENREPTQRSDDETQLFRTLDGVGRWLLEAAHRTPRLVVFDDLHRADATSLRLLKHVLHVAVSAPLVLMGTFRDNEIGEGHALLPLLDDLPGCGVRFDLAGVDVDAVSELVARSTGNVPPAGG